LRLPFLCFCFVSIFTTASALRAGPWTKVVEEIVEHAAGVGKRNTERVFVIREAERVSLPPIRFDEATLLRRFERLQGANPALRAEFKALPGAERRIVVELGEGAEHVLNLHPGESGTRLLQHLDAAGLAQSRTYGDFVIDGMAWLQSDDALAAMRGSISEETRATIARTLGRSASIELSEREVAELWKSAVRKNSGGVGQFWRVYVAPHKGKWLAGGLLISYLAMPERFHDAAGKLTKYGAREIAKLLGDSMIGAGQGFVEGLSDSVERHYADAPVTTVAELVAIVVLVVLSIPRLRALVWRALVRPASAVPEVTSAGQTAADKSKLPTHAPLRE